MTGPVAGLFVAAMGALIACAVLAWVFVWRYSRLTWRRTAEGRHLMRFTILLGLTFTTTAVLNVVPPPPIVSVSVSLVLFGAIAAELYTRIALLHEAQRDREGE